jgi:hypothetical protein
LQKKYCFLPLEPTEPPLLKKSTVIACIRRRRRHADEFPGYV